MKNKFLLMLTALISLIIVSGCGTESDVEADGNSSSEGNSHSITFSHFWPSHHVVHTDVLESFQSDLDKQTEGRISLDLFPSNQLGGPDEQYSLAVNGNADIALSVHGYTPGEFQLTSVSDLPFIAQSSEEGSEIMAQLYDEFPELQDEHNDVTPLWLFAGEPNQILSADKEIKSLEDLNGLTVRSPSPITTQLIEELGGVPVSMPVTDIYESLDRGVIDAAMAGASTLNDMNLHEVVDYVTIANLSTSSMFAVMNTNTFDSLSEEDQLTIEEIVKDYPTESGAALDRGGEDGIDKAEEAGITIYELDEEALEEWETKAQPVIDRFIEGMEADGLPGQEVYSRAKELAE